MLVAGASASSCELKRLLESNVRGAVLELMGVPGVWQEVAVATAAELEQKAVPATRL